MFPHCSVGHSFILHVFSLFSTLLIYFYINPCYTPADLFISFRTDPTDGFFLSPPFDALFFVR